MVVEEKKKDSDYYYLSYKAELGRRPRELSRVSMQMTTLWLFHFDTLPPPPSEERKNSYKSNRLLRFHFRFKIEITHSDTGLSACESGVSL
jgi:hypothetical protein